MQDDHGASRAVLFDFDFTIVDPSLGALDSFNWAFDRLGIDHPPPQDILGTIGLPLRVAFERLTGSACRYEEFLASYMGRADQTMSALTTPLPGSVEALSKLRETRRIGIVSTKIRRRVQETLSSCGMTGLVDVIVAGDDVRRNKPDPEGLLRALIELRSDRHTSFYVGDSVVDARTAHNAGVPFVAVLTGTTARHEFASHPCAGVIPDLRDIVALADKVPGTPEPGSHPGTSVPPASSKC